MITVGSQSFRVGVGVVLIAVIIGVLTSWLLARQRSSRYDSARNIAVLGDMRESIERRMYDLANRLTATEERFADVNHLLLSSQQAQPQTGTGSRAPSLGAFFGRLGVTEEDLIVRPDLVLLLVPYHPRFEVLYRTIVDACHDIGLVCVRGDEQKVDAILPHILKTMVQSLFVIAVIDGRNPNVFYELGIAQAIDKRTVLVARDPTTAASAVDVKGHYTIFYGGYSPRAFRGQLRDQMAKTLVAMAADARGQSAVHEQKSSASSAARAPAQRRASCPWCGSHDVVKRQTDFAIGVASGGIPKARHGSYYHCRRCGVTYSDGDQPMVVDGEVYNLHKARWGADQLSGLLVTGPWGKPVDDDTASDVRVVLQASDLPDDFSRSPEDHFDEIQHMIRARRAKSA